MERKAIAVAAAAAILAGALVAPAASWAKAARTRDTTLMSASVDADGRILHSNGVVEVQARETGFFGGTFARRLRKCDVLVSHSSKSLKPLGGFAIVGAKRTGARKVVVFTLDPVDATPEDHPFGVIAVCAR